MAEPIGFTLTDALLDFLWKLELISEFTNGSITAVHVDDFVKRSEPK